MKMRKLGLRFLWSLSVALAVFGVTSGNAVAEVRRSFINQSFEEPELGPTSCYAIIDQVHVPGWNTDHADGNAPINGCANSFDGGSAEIEMWAHGANGSTALHGNQLVELNAYFSSRLSQNVCINKKDTVTWSFGHKSRSAKETMEMTIGAPFDKSRPNHVDPDPESIVEVYSSSPSGGGGINSVSQGEAEHNEAGVWNRFSGEFEYTGDSGEKSIGFGAVGGSASGNLLDDIHITLRPYVEIAGSSFVTREGKNDVGMPAVRVVGELPQDLKVRLRVTGGTGTLGSDYTMPMQAEPGDAGVGDIFVITIPAGDYGESRLFPIGFASISDEEDDLDEIDTVTFEMLAPEEKTYVNGGVKPGHAAAQKSAS